MERFQAVCFDLFDTLIQFDPILYRNAHIQIAEKLNFPIGDFLNSWRLTEHSARIGEFKSIKERCAAILRQMNIDSGKMEEKTDVLAEMERDALRKSVQFIPHITNLLEVLMHHRKKLALISNASSAGLEIAGILRLNKYFSAMIFSFMEKVRKPEPEIYLLACDRLKVEPNQTAFVSDGDGGELAGAIKVGMFAYRFDPLRTYQQRALPPGTIDCPTIEILQERLLSHTID